MYDSGALAREAGVFREMDNVTSVLAELQEERRRLLAELTRVDRIIGVIGELTGAEPQELIADATPFVAAPLHRRRHRRLPPLLRRCRM
jgi:hypothetical protein